MREAPQSVFQSYMYTHLIAIHLAQIQSSVWTSQAAVRSSQQVEELTSLLAEYKTKIAALERRVAHLDGSVE